MAKCAWCDKETELYINGIPLCLDCDRDRESGRKPLQKEQPPVIEKKKAADGD
jgi:hypothetical protein